MARKKKSDQPIQNSIVEFLCMVEKTDADGFKHGYSYKAILAKLKKRHPKAETTKNCLRWYAAKLNSTSNKQYDHLMNGKKLPHFRPRSGT